MFLLHLHKSVTE